MTYLLDTNVCIKLLNNSSSAIVNELKRHEPEEIYLSTIVHLELYYGAYKSQRKEQNLAKLQRFISQFNTLFFDEQSAKIAGAIRSNLSSQGIPIGPYDLQIAAIAIVNDLILITHNVKEFSRIENLKYQDWEIEL